MPGFCQINKDSALEAHSEKWKVKQNKGLFGLAKPVFGPYITLGVLKLDSPVIKKKTKDRSEFEAEITSGGSDIDIGKLLTIEKRKLYKLLIERKQILQKLCFQYHLSPKKKDRPSLVKCLVKMMKAKMLC